MNCAHHPDVPATAYCRTCGKALCANCTRNVRGVIYCEDCLASRVEGVPSAAPAPGAAPPASAGAYTPLVPGGPNPAVAGVLSAFLPFGTGVMYCGEFTRALIHAGVFFGLIAAQVSLGSNAGPDALMALVGMGIAFWYFFMIFDSVRVARAKQRGVTAPDLFGMGVTSAGVGWLGNPSAAPAAGGAFTPNAPDRGRRMPVGPIILIGLGILFLLNTTDLFDVRWDRVVWFAFVFWGAAALWRRQQNALCGCSRCGCYGYTGPCVIMTVGVLGLLDSYTRFGWHETWPVFLIVLGIIKMLQLTASTEGHIEPPAGPGAAMPPAEPPVVEGEVRHG